MSAKNIYWQSDEKYLKKQLLNLSKPQLTKLCKTKKVSLSSNKHDMVNALIKKVQNKRKKKKKKKNNKHISQKSIPSVKSKHIPIQQSSQTETKEEKCHSNDTESTINMPYKIKERKVRLLGWGSAKISLDLLIIGYLHNYIDDYSNTYPIEIMYFIRRFCDDTRCLTFDVCKNQYRKCVKDWGSLIERGVYNSPCYQGMRPSKALFGSPLGLTEGVHEWKIKIKQASEASIGITSANTLGQFTFGGYAYYVSCSTSGVKLNENTISDKRWKTDDIITFNLNFPLSTITVSVDKTDISAEIMIEKWCKYYPFIQSEANNSKFILVGYTC
eukprot:409498_1